jgi:peptide/nickel transport system substrate-binding protein
VNDAMRRTGRPGRLALAAAVLGVTALVAAACGGGSDDADSSETVPPAGEEFGRELVEEDEPVYGGRLVVALPGETDGWHPTANNWATEGHFVGSAIFEGLATFNDDGTVEPYLAESITHNEDFTVWTVTVRKGITFHDGQALDAEAVKKNLESATGEGLTALTFEGTIEEAGINAIDERTVEIRLTRPRATFDRIFAGVPGYMAAPAMLDSEDASLRPIGTGPFEFTQWTRDSSFLASRYDDYWQTDEDGNQLPYLDEIEYRVIVDDDSRASSLESGDVDMILTTNADDVKDARESDDTISVEDTFSEETFIMLNTAQPPFDNINARKALAYGTDVQAAIDTIGGGITVPATSAWADGTPWEVDDPGWVEYDPDKAREALAAYEAETGGPLTFTFAGISQLSVINLQQLLVEQWRGLGIDAGIETLEQTAYITNTATGNYEASWFRSYSFTDPDNNYVFWHSDFANGVGELSINFTQATSDELDDLLDRGRESDDFEVRRQIYQDVARELNALFANIWLFQTPFALIARPEVHGLNPAREHGFGNLQPKPWIGGLWLTDPAS